jgi:hypothetical protein
LRVPSTSSIGFAKAFSMFAGVAGPWLAAGRV